MTNDPIPPAPGEQPGEPSGDQPTYGTPSSEQPPYARSPYQQSPYQQSPYGQPSYGSQPVRTDGGNTQLYGVLGIVLAVVACAPLGILFGWLSIKEARTHGQSQTLGKVALWLGIALTALVVLAGLCALGAIIIGSTQGDTNYR